MVFFFVQFKSKIITSAFLEKKTSGDSEANREGDKPQKMIMLTFLISFIGAGLAELASVPFYYPYDLMKVRIQTMN